MVEMLVVMDLLKSVMMMVYSTLTPSLSTSGAAAHIKFTTTCVSLAVPGTCVMFWGGEGTPARVVR